MLTLGFTIDVLQTWLRQWVDKLLLAALGCRCSIQLRHTVIRHRVDSPSKALRVGAIARLMTFSAVLPRVGPSLILILLALVLRVLPERSLKIILHCWGEKVLRRHLLHTCELLVLGRLLHHEEHVVLLLLLLHLVLVLGRIWSLEL